MENMTFTTVFGWFLTCFYLFVLDMSSVFVYKRFFAENKSMTLDIKQLFSLFYKNERIAVCEDLKERRVCKYTLVSVH